ncbi:MAG TPA: stage II sporulation protein E [Clostridia bacterium]|jgi:hypothetical protein|nr:stage II sporulation protein E [Clostridia bacterium]
MPNQKGEYEELEKKRKELTELVKKYGTSHHKVQILNQEVEQLMLKLQRKK